MESSFFDLTGKLALVITTKDGGIGHAQAVGLAKHGADVVVASTEPGKHPRKRWWRGFYRNSPVLTFW